MTPGELKFFMKFILRQYWHEVKSVLGGISNLARPRFWLFIFSLILIYTVAFVKERISVFLVLFAIVFIWMWDIWEQGHWRGFMRKEYMDKIKVKNETDKQRTDEN